MREVSHLPHFFGDKNRGGTMKDLKEIVEPLIRWFRENKRDLPWRQTKDPYAVWVSEIMLQQTRVEAVKPYYIRFLQTLPTVKDLANAD